MSNGDTLRFSIGIAGSKPLGDYIALARMAEEYGFHTFSIFDDLMFKPAWPILFAVAPHTQTMQVGPSVCNPYLVHPAILAGNAALLDEQTGGRAYLGIGRGEFGMPHGPRGSVEALRLLGTQVLPHLKN